MKKNKDKGISVNERRQYQSGSQEMNFIVQQLVKNGNTKSDAIKMTQKHYNNVLKRYKEPWFIHPVKKAEIISSLSANESVNEAKLSDEELVKYALYIKKYKPGLWNQMKKNADMKQLIKKFKLEKKESVNEAGMELNKLKDAIKMLQKKIEKQGGVTNARDEEHLSNLIKLYVQMGGKGIKESLFGIVLKNMAKHAAQKRMYDKLKKKKHTKESDLPTTSKKEKTLRAVHKTSGKEVVYVDTPSVRKKLKRMGFVIKESVNEEKYVVYVDKDGKGIRGRKIVKSGLSQMSAKRLYNKLVKTDDYQEVGYDDHKSWNQNNIEKIKESVNEDLYYGYYKNKEVKVNAKSDKDAKKQIISKLKIPKGDLNRASMINHTKNNPVAEGKANIYGIEYRKVGQSGAKFQKSSLTMSSSQGRKMHKKMTMAIIQKAEKLRKQDNWADYRITVNGAPYIGWGGKAITGYPPPKLNEAPGKNHKDQYVGQARVKVEPGTYKGQKVNFHDVSMYRDHKKPYHYYLSIKLAHSNKVDMVVDTGTHIQSKAGKWAQGFMKRRMGGTGNERFS
jgi:hypothetical protein